MWVKERNGRVPLRIDSIDAEISLVGDLAETTLTLRFKNETNRIQEGEFVMPLPIGSTVSSYALEVNGHLRDGVAVEKKQARNAYETIKRQKIDPGLIEREADNTYRTKVFPIPARGTKLVRISYIEQLRQKNGELHYTLPTQYPGTVNQFTCTIRQQHTKNLTIQSDDLDFGDDETGKASKKASVSDHLFTGDITITTEPHDGLLLTEPVSDDSSASYFYLSYNPPPEAIEKPRNTPKHINIIWDASDSNRRHNHSQELQLLDLYFKQLPPDQPTKVTLQTLRNTLSHAGEYSVRQGDWKKLRATLEHLFYDGSTDFSSIQASQHPADLTLIFTDARRSEDSDALRILPQQTTFIFHRGPNTLFNKQTTPTYGVSVNLTESGIDTTLHHLTTTRFRVERIISEHSNVFPATSKRPGKQNIVGIFKKTPNQPIKILYQNGNGETINQRVSTSVIKQNQSGDTLKRFWAQEKLVQLENQGNNKAKIIAHCRSHGLVSDFTSLIVLERFQDYVRFNIPPPEPELRMKWEVERNKKIIAQRPKERLETKVRQVWLQRVRWYDRSFTWRTETLVHQTTQVKKWLHAINTVFQKQDVDPQAYGVIESWYKENLQHAGAEKKIKDSASYLKWAQEEKKLMLQWATFPAIPIKKSLSQKLAVSVRGLVDNPMTYRSDNPLTLKKAIQLAGGLHPMGSLQSISLYRNAHALTYNLLSKEYKDIPLLPGDMLVAGTEPYDSSYACDPFGSDTDDIQSTPPQLKPAVSANIPQVTGKAGGDDAFGGTEGGLPRNKIQLNARILPPVDTHIDQKALKQFEQQLTNNANPLVSYKKLKGKQPRTDAFYARAAKILQQHKHPKLAIQVLSNIKEEKPKNLITQRAFAYALGGIGRYDDSLAIFQSIQQSHPTDIQNRLDIERYRQRANLGSVPAYTPDYQKIIVEAMRYQMTPSNADAMIDPMLIAHTLTERNAPKNHKTSPTAIYLRFPHNLASDIRCVIYSSNPKVNVSFRIKEPNEGATTRWRPSLLGGQIFSATGVQEYMLKRAMPGSYQFRCSSYYPVTIQVAIYTHWGTQQQVCQWRTIHLNAKGPNKPIAECQFKL